MSPRKITPMKYRGFYCSDELYTEMQRIATELNESDSEYIRKAVENRNGFEKHNTAIENYPEQQNPQKKMLSELSDDEMGSIAKQLRQSKQVKTFPKGGK